MFQLTTGQTKHDSTTPSILIKCSSEAGQLSKWWKRPPIIPRPSSPVTNSRHHLENHTADVDKGIRRTSILPCSRPRISIHIRRDECLRNVYASFICIPDAAGNIISNKNERISSGITWHNRRIIKLACASETGFWTHNGSLQHQDIWQRMSKNGCIFC